MKKFVILKKKSNVEKESKKSANSEKNFILMSIDENRWDAKWLLLLNIIEDRPIVHDIVTYRENGGKDKWEGREKKGKGKHCNRKKRNKKEEVRGHWEEVNFERSSNSKQKLIQKQKENKIKSKVQ